MVNGSAAQALLDDGCIVEGELCHQAVMRTRNANGVEENPENSDNLAQRNQQLTFSDNPGPASTPHTADL
jgi:hypothetical protein